jgi:hypothetical protein
MHSVYIHGLKIDTKILEVVLALRATYLNWFGKSITVPDNSIKISSKIMGKAYSFLFFMLRRKLTSRFVLETIYFILPI